MKKKAKARKAATKPAQSTDFDLAQRVNDVSGAFVASIERLVKQALQEHIRAATADLVGRAPSIAARQTRVATGGGPLSGPASTASTKGTKSKAAKKNKPSRAEKVSVSSFDDSELEAKVLAFLEASPGSRVEALTEGLKARPDAIRRVVARLFEQKKLTRKGKTRGTKYSLTPKG